MWYCSRRNRSKKALRTCSSSGLEKVSSLRLVFLVSSDDPGPWDRRDPAAVEPSLCPRMFQGGNASQEAPNNLFNTCDLSRLDGHCLRKRLDRIFNSGHALQEER